MMAIINLNKQKGEGETGFEKLFSLKKCQRKVRSVDSFTKCFLCPDTDVATEAHHRVV